LLSSCVEIIVRKNSINAGTMIQVIHAMVIYYTGYIIGVTEHSIMVRFVSAVTFYAYENH